jgi:hypothetical protein
MVRTEARVQARERIWVSTAAISLAMAALLLVTAPGFSRAVAPYVLLFEVATVGAVFAARAGPGRVTAGAGGRHPPWSLTA